MPTQLPIVALYAMDKFYQNYAGETDFFQIEDFVFHVGNVVAGMYQQVYKEQYAINRSDKNDEVVTFDVGWLEEQILKVERKDGRLFAAFEKPIMSFSFDNNTTGIQEVFDFSSDKEIQRIGISEIWKFKYLPVTDDIFFYGDKGGISFKSMGSCNINKVRVLVVPSVNNEMSIPDGMIADAIDKTVMVMRNEYDKRVVKKTLDQNPNQLEQTEINTLSMK